MEGTSLLSRIGLAVSEALAEHGLSLKELAALSGVSRATCTKLVRGGRVRLDLAVRIATAVAVVDLYSSPPVVLAPEAFVSDELLDGLVAGMADRGWAA